MGMVKDLNEKMDIMNKQMRTFSREMNYLVKIEILKLKNMSVLGHKKERSVN